MKAVIKPRITNRSWITSSTTEEGRIVKRKGLAVCAKKSSIRDGAKADGGAAPGKYVEQEELRSLGRDQGLQRNQEGRDKNCCSCDET